MSDRDVRILEVVELIKIWASLRGSHWPNAKAALEERINTLADDLFANEKPA